MYHRTRANLGSLQRSGHTVGDRSARKFQRRAENLKYNFPVEKAVLGSLLLFVVCFMIVSFAKFASFRRVEPEDEWFDYTPEQETMHLSRSNAVLPAGRVFVCITGQRQRLELHNKVKHILNPLRDSGWDVHVALVVSDDEEIIFTNAGKKGNSSFSSYQDAQNYLLSNNYTVLTNQPVEQVSPGIIRKNYFQQLDKKVMRWEKRRRRVDNHIRQFEILTQCGKIMSKVASPRFSSSSSQSSLFSPLKAKYNLVVRVRDDVGLLEPLQVKNLMNLLFGSSLPSRTTVSSDCPRWNGVNDQIVLVPPEAAFDYFMSPLIHFYTRPIHLNVTNLETFLLYTYLNVGIHTVHSSYLRDVVKLNPFNNTKPEQEMIIEEVNDTECHDEDKHIIFSPNRGMFKKDRFIYNVITLI